MELRDLVVKHDREKKDARLKKTFHINVPVLSTCFMVKPSQSKLREISWTKLDYLTRNASHQSTQIDNLKGTEHEHFVFPCLTHIVNRPVLQ